MADTLENSMQDYINQQLNRRSRLKIDYRIFDRKTKSFICNPSKFALSLAENDIVQVNGKAVPDSDFVIQQYAGVKDCKDRKIYEGDFLQTNEGGWRAFVVFSDGIFTLEDPDGGYSTLPEWHKCEIISNICEMDGHTHDFIRKKEKYKTSLSK